MDFNHTEERRMLADSLRRTLERGASWSDLAELGVLGALFTEDEGGFGGDGYDIAVVFEELGRAGCTLPVLETGLAGGLLADCGKSDLVEQVIGGELRVALAHAEPGLRYDIGPITTTANNGTISGRKSVVSAVDEADLLIVSAMDYGTLALFSIDPKGAGVTLHTTPSLDGGTVSEVTLDAAPATALGGEISMLEARLATATLAVCADAVGAIETVKEMTLDYLRTRTQFGVPIGSFQALQHRAAHLWCDIEVTASAVLNAGRQLDADSDNAALAVSLAKARATATAQLSCLEGVQMHGGIGMTDAFDMGFYLKRARVSA